MRKVKKGSDHYEPFYLVGKILKSFILQIYLFFSLLMVHFALAQIANNTPTTQIAYNILFLLSIMSVYFYQ
ncbi:Uncharacterised protein [Haemophilus influenzae]|uniref:Uncharacterized protein n=1 Tax=Haemophilus influenzae TaxID=727 RepID=A0A2X1PZE4_HAEIF|nr:Uncharacterised protein [Haemophilus influenzae]